MAKFPVLHTFVLVILRRFDIRFPGWGARTCTSSRQGIISSARTRDSGLSTRQVATPGLSGWTTPGRRIPASTSARSIRSRRSCMQCSSRCEVIVVPLCVSRFAVFLIHFCFYAEIATLIEVYAEVRTNRRSTKGTLSHDVSECFGKRDMRYAIAPLCLAFLSQFARDAGLPFPSLKSSYLFSDPDKPEGYDEPHSQQTRISKCIIARARRLFLRGAFACSYASVPRRSNRAYIFKDTRLKHVPVNIVQAKVVITMRFPTRARIKLR